MLKRIARNPLIDLLVHLKGNERACLWTEPLWGIPYNLYVPFVSVYMAALGMTPVQIGAMSTIFFISQMFWALLSGVLTDKLGRRRCTVIFDLLSWSVPTFLWMLAQDYRWFVAAALFNGMWRVTENSWDLLLMEDSEPSRLVRLYAVSHVAGLLAGFVAPLAYLLVRAFGLVPTMRAIYGFTFVLMTTKFIVLYFLSHETKVGERRMRECANVPLLTHLLDSRHVLRAMLQNRAVMLTVGMVASYAAIKNVLETFWPLLLTDRLGIAPENLSIFSTVKSLLMLVCYFTIVPRVSVRRFRLPLFAGVGILAASQLCVLLMPAGAYWMVVLSVLLEALALSTLNPLTTSIQMLTIDPEERARMLGLFYAMMLLVTAPFGLIAGVLSELNRALPLVLTLGMTAFTMFMGVCIARESGERLAQAG